MILRRTCLRVQSVRSLQTSSKALAAAAPAKNISPQAQPPSVKPNPSKPNLHDPLYKHPPSAAVVGTPLKGCQILKDQPEISALSDNQYPDWLWQLLDDPAPVEALKAFRKQEKKKREIYIAQLEEIERQKKLELIDLSQLPKEGEKRTEEERLEAKRNAMNQRWVVNRETEYDYPQFEMPPERNRKYHKAIRKEKIKQDNYLRAKGLK